MADGHGQHPVLALHRRGLVHEGAHQRQRGWIAGDLPAVVQRHRRAHLFADGAQDQGQQVLGAFHHVGMRELLVEDDDVGNPHTLQREMAVRVKLDTDHTVRANDRAHLLDHIAFGVIVAMRHHRSVQPEQHAIQRHGGFELGQDFIAHELVVGAVGGAGGAGGEAASLDQGEAVRGRTATRDPERGRAHQWRVFRVLSGAEEHAFPVGRQAGWQRRECVGFGGHGGREQAHDRDSGAVEA